MASEMTKLTKFIFRGFGSSHFLTFLAILEEKKMSLFSKTATGKLTGPFGGNC